MKIILGENWLYEKCCIQRKAVVLTGIDACICRKASVHLLLQPCGLDLPGDDQIKFGLGM